MRFSARFDVARSVSDDWFDPFLVVDTPLFVDPFLIYAHELGTFEGSHEEIISFFNGIFGLIAQSGCNPSSVQYRKAVGDLRMPEADELCLGYTAAGTRGSGSGRDLANLMASAIAEAIGHGVTQLSHFEQIAILREGIGSDRISDATANIIRHRLCRYTEGICLKHGIPTEPRLFRRGYYDNVRLLWCPLSASLPVNPYSSRPILLVPERYLGLLPTMNPNDFWEYGCGYENDVLRSEFNYDLSLRVAKAEIIRLASSHPDMLQRYAQYVESHGASSYDFRRDKKGLVQWFGPTQEYCQQNPVEPAIVSEDTFIDAIEQMLIAYRHFIEEKGGWRLLWNDNGESKSEKAAQLTLLGVLHPYCEFNNIDITREADVGRGPVDFKVSAGYTLRALIEIKLARNTRFWEGLRAQLPTYLHAERIRCGFFLVVAHTDDDMKRVADVQAALHELNKSSKYNIKAIIVDARRKQSASKVNASRPSTLPTKR